MNSWQVVGANHPEAKPVVGEFGLLFAIPAGPAPKIVLPDEVDQFEPFLEQMMAIHQLVPKLIIEDVCLIALSTGGVKSFIYFPGALKNLKERIVIQVPLIYELGKPERVQNIVIKREQLVGNNFCDLNVLSPIGQTKLKGCFKKLRRASRRRCSRELRKAGNEAIAAAITVPAMPATAMMALFSMMRTPPIKS